ncbi:MAG: Sec-independent protein translocase subunit TatA [Gammaproteobacteria bacterium]|nr:Sec-independent protein translocase subunit TatA [Gammaproteobacteria bacterium]
MGFGGISIWQLLIILAIVVLIFGTKKLKIMGSDVGGAVKNFKNAMNDSDKESGKESSDDDETTQRRISSEDDTTERASEKDSSDHRS